jgi:hypothetical protein
MRVALEDLGICCGGRDAQDPRAGELKHTRLEID